MIEEIDETKMQIKKFLQNDFTVYVFYSSWCGPWQEYFKIISETALEYPEVCFCLIDIDKNPQLKKEFQIQKIPLSLFYQKGELLTLKTGLVLKTELLNLIQVIKN